MTVKSAIKGLGKAATMLAVFCASSTGALAQDSNLSDAELEALLPNGVTLETIYKTKPKHLKRISAVGLDEGGKCVGINAAEGALEACQEAVNERIKQAGLITYSRAIFMSADPAHEANKKELINNITKLMAFEADDKERAYLAEAFGEHFQIQNFDKSADLLFVLKRDIDRFMGSVGSEKQYRNAYNLLSEIAEEANSPEHAKQFLTTFEQMYGFSPQTVACTAPADFKRYGFTIDDHFKFKNDIHMLSGSCPSPS